MVLGNDLAKYQTDENLSQSLVLDDDSQTRFFAWQHRIVIVQSIFSNAYSSR
jgi:hypothetical protein